MTTPASGEEVEHFQEIRARVDAGQTLALQAMLGEVDKDRTLECLARLFGAISLHLKALGR